MISFVSSDGVILDPNLIYESSVYPERNETESWIF